MARMGAVEATVDAVVEGMDADGYCIVEGLLERESLAWARASLLEVLDATPLGRNDFEGFGTKRVYALFAKTRAFDGPAIHPLVLGVLDRVLTHYQLSAPTGILIGAGEKAQPVHRDEGIYPLPASFPDVVVNTMWALDDFTTDNGATRFIPASHRWNDRRPSDADEFGTAVMPAGSVLFYPGKLWHGGGANTTEVARLGVILEYASAWLRPQENHILAVPREVVAELPSRLQELLGYNIYPPFVGYVDGRHPRRYIIEPVRMTALPER
ncbi:MAG: phytanoyl-CoA dioxygenase family protein [Acidimicrobiales bacterium]